MPRKPAAAAATRRAKAAEDDALLNAALKQAEAERRALEEQRACEMAAEQRRAEEEAQRNAVRILPEDRVSKSAMPSLVLPHTLLAAPELLKMMQRTDPTASVGVGASSGADPAKDYSKETARERELRLREARAKLKYAQKVAQQRRNGKKAVLNYQPPPLFHGDETAEEVASRPQLIHEYMRKYAEWLTRHIKSTGLLDNRATCPDHFCLLFRFDTTDDPVVRHPKSKLGGRLDVLIVCYARVLYYVWSDYVDGLLAAATKTPHPITDIRMGPYNVVEVLAGGKRPTGLGVRITKLDELVRMPYLSSEYYPNGIPCSLALQNAEWGSDLGPEGPADSVSRAMLEDDEEALDSDDEDDDDRQESAAAAAEDPIAVEIRKQVRRLGRTRFPLCQEILDAFRPDYEAVDGGGGSATATAAADVRQQDDEDGDD